MHPSDLGKRLGVPVRVRGIEDEIGRVATGIAEGARTAGQGIGDAAQGVSQAATETGGNVSAAATSAADTAAGIGKTLLIAVIGIPALAIVGGTVALVVLGRGGQKMVEKVAPEALRAAPDVLPLLAPLIGPEAAIPMALGGLARGRRSGATAEPRAWVQEADGTWRLPTLAELAQKPGETLASAGVARKG